MKPKWLMFFILFAAYGLAEAQAESNPFSASIYRHQKLEAVTNCATPERSFIRPQFKARDAKGLVDRTLAFGDNAPFTDLNNTFWQLDITKEHLGRSFLAFSCEGEKFYAFQVFRGGSLRPIMIVGVSENDPSIFDSAQRLTDQQAGERIMGKGELIYVAPNASAPSAPVAAAAPAPQTPSSSSQSLGIGSRFQISKEDVAAANEQATTPPIAFKRVATKKVSTPAPPPQQVVTTGDLMSYYHRATPWSNQRNTFGWTETAVNALSSRWAKISRARDLQTFCPGYYGSSSEKKMACVLRIFTYMAKFESGFNPRPKDFKENTGEISRGLFSMSLHQCPNARSAAELFDPNVNIECAAIVFANSIEKDGYITGPKGARGASQNWSCLREPYYTHVNSLGKTVRVGYKEDIIRFASNYNRIL